MRGAFETLKRRCKRIKKRTQQEQDKIKNGDDQINQNDVSTLQDLKMAEDGMVQKIKRDGKTGATGILMAKGNKLKSGKRLVKAKKVNVKGNKIRGAPKRLQMNPDLQESAIEKFTDESSKSRIDIRSKKTIKTNLSRRQNRGTRGAKLRRVL